MVGKKVVYNTTRMRVSFPIQYHAPCATRHAPRAMRSQGVALLLTVALATILQASDLRNFEDAGLRAVQFVNAREGWAAGDEGAIWHTLDGGATWDRQQTGVRASLRSLHFFDSFAGWAAGREELPHGAGSVGILLFTRDGGVKWQRGTFNAMPGLNCVRFTDTRTGYAAGDGTDQFPTGLFQTGDGGRSWQAVPGPRCTTWLAADFLSGGGGALCGSWNRLATLGDGKVTVSAADTLGGRNLHGLQLAGKNGAAVGQGAMVLLSDGTSGTAWSIADLKDLPREVRRNWDFHAVHCVGSHIWVAGRPGSVIVHSGDRGNNWEVQRTGQPIPLQGIWFIDEQHGWAVGELGTILATRDGGKSWNVQRTGRPACCRSFHSCPGQRTAGGYHCQAWR